MLLFFSITILFLSVILICVLSEIKLIIEQLELSNHNKKMILKYEGRICLYLCGKIKLLSFKFDNNKISKISKKKVVQKRVDKIKKDNNYIKKISWQILYNVIKQLKQKLKIDTLKLQLYIDTEDVILTSYIVGITSIVIPNIIRSNIKKFNKRKYELKIFPLYQNRNYINLILNSIISIKVVHIINMFKVMGGVKHERTSNRRFNVNCYGKY